MNRARLIEARKLAGRPYRVAVMKDETTDGQAIFLVANPELPGCMAQGATIEDAMLELETARLDYITSLLEDRLPVPTPQASKVETVGSDFFEGDVQVTPPDLDFLLVEDLEADGGVSNAP